MKIKNKFLLLISLNAGVAIGVLLKPARLKKDWQRILWSFMLFLPSAAAV